MSEFVSHCSSGTDSLATVQHLLFGFLWSLQHVGCKLNLSEGSKVRQDVVAVGSLCLSSRAFELNTKPANGMVLVVSGTYTEVRHRLVDDTEFSTCFKQLAPNQ